MLPSRLFAVRLLALHVSICASASGATGGEPQVPESAILAWARGDALPLFNGEVRYERVAPSGARSSLRVISLSTRPGHSFVQEVTKGAAVVFAESKDYVFRAERATENGTNQLVQFCRRGAEAERLRAQVRKRIVFSVGPLLLAGARVAGEPLSSVVASSSFKLLDISESGDKATMLFQYHSAISRETSECRLQLSIANNWSVQSFHVKSPSRSSTGRVTYVSSGGGMRAHSYEVKECDVATGACTWHRFNVVVENVLDDLSTDDTSLARFGLSEPRISLTPSPLGRRRWLVACNLLCVLGGAIYIYCWRIGRGHRAATGGVSKLSLWFCLSLAAILFCGFSIGRVSWRWIGPSSWGPRIECSPTVELGHQRTNVRFHRTIAISNTGRELLRIERISASCGCMIPLITEAAIPPGHSLQLPVTIKLEVADEYLRKPLLIQSNDPSRPLVTMYIVADVVALGA